MDRVAMIRERLDRALAPERVEIVDESHKHAGHPGAKHGGHFAALIVSDRFRGLPTLARHRLVYASVSDIMPGEIHALSIRALTPEEHQSPERA